MINSVFVVVQFSVCMFTVAIEATQPVHTFNLFLFVFNITRIQAPTACDPFQVENTLFCPIFGPFLLKLANFGKMSLKMPNQPR